VICWEKDHLSDVTFYELSHYAVQHHERRRTAALIALVLVVVGAIASTFWPPSTGPDDPDACGHIEIAMPGQLPGRLVMVQAATPSTVTLWCPGSGLTYRVR
jgi:hypothetical protein